MACPHSELRPCYNNLFPALIPFLFLFAWQPVVNPFPHATWWRGDRNTSLPAKPYGLFLLSVPPFSLVFCLPPCAFSISPSEILCFWTANLFRRMDMKEFQPSPFVLKKNNAGRLRCPQHFLSSKTFVNPSFLIDACRKKKAHKLRWGMKAQKKVGRKKRPSRKGFLKKGL